ncbi:Unknown protein sequence [Pseudomonas syringae pv. syringae]|nr:Unknown protein sequence [Pseudomonas syringae pv. syringae]
MDSYLVHLQFRSRFSLGHTLGFAREHLGEQVGIYGCASGAVDQLSIDHLGEGLRQLS